MAKFDFKQFLLAKGEKIALGVGLAGLGLFGVLGVMNAVSAESPSKTAGALKTGASNVSSKIANPNSTAPPLPPWITEGQGATFKPIDADQFVVGQTFFEPVDFPSRLRENPKVLGITTAQLDLVRAPMKAFDVKVMPDGTRQIGVLTRVKVNDSTAKAVEQMLKGTDANKRLTGQRQQRPQQNRPQPPGGLGGRGGGMGQPGPGGMGMPGGGPGMPGGGDGSGSPDGGGPGGMGGMGGFGGMAGMFGGRGGGFDQQGERLEATVTYISVDDFDKKNPVPAFTVYPLRMVVVHASFPLREQLEEVRRALRLQTLDEARQLSIPGTTGATSGGLGGTPPAPQGPRGLGGLGGTGTDDGGGAGGTGLAASTGSSGGPVFAGFEVERRVTAPNGQRFDWQPYDHEGVYVDRIWSRKVADQLDDGYLSYFIRYDQMMAMPLPALAEGLSAYPKVNLPPIVAAVKKMEEMRKPQIKPSEQQEKFKARTGGANPFLPQAGGTGAAGGAAGGAFGEFLGGGGMSPGVGSGPPMPGMPGGGYGGRGGGQGMQSSPPTGGGGGAGGGSYGRGQQSGPPKPGMGGGPGGPGGYPGMPGGYPGMPGGYPGARGGYPGGPNNPYAQAQQQQTDTPEKDHLLLRFLDPDVHPGYTYEYRIRVKLKNPNLGRKDVGRPSDAEAEILFGDWVRITTSVTVTSELNLYATDPVEYANKVRDKYKDQAVVNLLDNRNGETPVVQVQQWMEQVKIESKREPVGTWVIGEVPVQRGEYIGRKQIVPLPMWSAEKGTYLLQELPKYKVWKAREQPKGLLVDFTTPFLLVDYEGGKVRPAVADRRVEDEAFTEMLVLRPDGSLTVRSAREDIPDKDREERQKKWEEWIANVTNRTQQVGLPTDPSGGGGGNDFKRN